MVLWAKVDITELCDIRRQGGASIGGVMSVSPTENETGAAPETVSPPSESQTTDVNIAESSSADEGAEQGSLLDAVTAALAQNGRASCRARVCQYRLGHGARRSIHKKKTEHQLT